MRITGALEAARRLAVAPSTIRGALGVALMEEARAAMRDSLAQVPVKDGVLKASGEVQAPKFGPNRVTVSLGYGGAASAYALYQHNAPAGFNYTKPGTKSHFLSDPIQRRVPQMMKTLSKRVGKILG